MLTEIFATNVSRAKDQLAYLRLLDLLEAILSQLEKGKIQSLQDVSNISNSLITKVNTRLEQIDDFDKKNSLENTILQVSNHLVMLLSKVNGFTVEGIIDHIARGMRNACELNGWNFDQAKRFLMPWIGHKADVLGDTESISLSFGKQNGKNTSPHYYDWLKANSLLDELAYKLKDAKYIKSTSSFLQLFSVHDGTIQVKLNEEKLEFLVILFDELYERGVLVSKGTKSGKFSPLARYCVDSDGNTFKNFQPKRVKENLKRKPEKYAKIKREVGDLICELK
ncbi:MAG: hypothetical protein AAFO69_15720 [Bacteroidota bacterium]